MRRAIFLGEGSSDAPLADIVAELFQRCGCELLVTTPALDLLPERVRADVRSKVEAALRLTRDPIDVFIVHRDADGPGSGERRDEIARAFRQLDPPHRHLPVVPIRMTEAWLLLDERRIREVAGNPRGRTPLHLPGASEVERQADPKARLAQALLAASGEKGRRRERVARRFNEHRRQLLHSLDLDGPITNLGAWKELLADVERTVELLR